MHRKSVESDPPADRVSLLAASKKPPDRSHSGFRRGRIFGRGSTLAETVGLFRDLRLRPSIVQILRALLWDSSSNELNGVRILGHRMTKWWC